MTMLFPRENPLLRDFTVPPFGEISEREFEPAIMDAMEMHKDEIAEILGNHHRPSFSNTIEPFTMSDLTLDKAVSPLDKTLPEWAPDELKDIEEQTVERDIRDIHDHKTIVGHKKEKRAAHKTIVKKSTCPTWLRHVM